LSWQAYEDLPDQRQSLVGADVEGEEVVLIRAISRKPYRCPNCGREVEIGSEHVVVRRSHPAREIKHTHWHRACVDAALRYTLRNLRPIPAAQSTEAALDRRYSRTGRSNRVRRR
jgi:hypothetical protein